MEMMLFTRRKLRISLKNKYGMLIMLCIACVLIPCVTIYSSEINAGTFSLMPSIALFVESGDAQKGELGTLLDLDFIAIVKDAANNPISGVSVDFSIYNTPSGATGHSISVQTATTDSTGKVSTRLKLGNVDGDYTVKAEINYSEASYAEKSSVSDFRIDSWVVYFTGTTCTDPKDADGDNYGYEDCDDCNPSSAAYHDQCCSPNEPGRILYRVASQEVYDPCTTYIYGSNDPKRIPNGCYYDTDCDAVPDICEKYHWSFSALECSIPWIEPQSSIIFESANGYSAIFSLKGYTGTLSTVTWGPLDTKVEPASYTPSSGSITQTSSIGTAIATAIWYEYPVGECNADKEADYYFWPQISIDGGLPIYVAYESSFTVMMPEEGGTTTLEDYIEELPEWNYDVLDENTGKVKWYYTGKGDLSKVLSKTTYYIPSNSNFYNKIMEHESIHRQQYDIGFDGHKLFDPDEFYNLIKNYTCTDNQDLSDVNLYDNCLTDKYLEFFSDYLDSEIEEDKLLERCMEYHAYEHSDDILPKNIYQNSCVNEFTQDDCE